MVKITISQGPRFIAHFNVHIHCTVFYIYHHQLASQPYAYIYFIFTFNSTYIYKVNCKSNMAAVKVIVQGKFTIAKVIVPVTMATN